MTRLLIQRAVENGCSYQFSVSTLAATRKYKMICNRLGIEHEICRDVRVPVKPIYEELNNKGIYLAVTHLKKKNDAENNVEKLLYS
jgi:hypothetical protein